jgi:uncharacterized protein (DUF362 family)
MQNSQTDTSKVARVQATGNLTEDLQKVIGAIDGLSWLPSNETVLVKPNYNTAHAPPGSTAADFLDAALEILRQRGAEDVIVGESTSLLNHRRVLQQAGVFDVARDYNVPVVVFDEEGWEKVSVGGTFLKRARLTRTLRRVRRIVYLCCPKTHHAAQFTGSLKLGMGFAHNWRRTLWHIRHLQEKIADLNLVLNLDLVLADMRKTFIAGGPATGELRQPGVILASRDRVAIDLEAVKIIQAFPGHELPEDALAIPQIARALKLGLGTDAYQCVDVSTQSPEADREAGRS